MKQNKKYPTKLLQIRLSEKELVEINDFVKKFGVTKRAFILAVMNELKIMNVIRNNQFYESDQQFAHCNPVWRAKSPNKCELCNDEYRHKSCDNRIVGHHFNGYKGKNSKIVKYLCRRCHGFAHRKDNYGNEWSVIVERHKKWDGRTKEGF